MLLLQRSTQTLLFFRSRTRSTTHHHHHHHHHHLFFSSSYGDPLWKHKASSFQIRSGRNLAVYTHRLTESDFWYDVIISRWWPWRHFTQKSAAIWWVNTKRLPGAHAAAFASFWSIVHLYLLKTNSASGTCISVCRSQSEQSNAAERLNAGVWSL